MTQEVTATAAAALLGAGLLLLAAPWWMWIVVYLGVVLASQVPKATGPTR